MKEKNNIKKEKFNFYYYIEENFKYFSNSEKVFVHFLLNNKKEAPFLSARQIANRIKIDPSTIIRFTKNIGFKGYAELQNSLKEFLLDEISHLSDLDKARSYRENYKGERQKDIIYSSINKSYSNLKELTENNNIEEIISFSKYICNSRKKIIIANRSSYSVGHFLYFELSAIIPDVYFLNNYDNSYYDIFKDLNKKDVIIAISSPRYSKLTIDFAKYALQKKLHLISITDSKVSPLFSISCSCLLAPVQSSIFHNSNVAIMALLDAVIAKVFSIKNKESIQRLEEGERILKDKKILSIC